MSSSRGFPNNSVGEVISLANLSLKIPRGFHPSGSATSMILYCNSWIQHDYINPFTNVSVGLSIYDSITSLSLLFFVVCIISSLFD